MTSRVEVTVSIEARLLERAEIVAKQLQISQNELFEGAIEAFVNQYASESTPTREINQGDIFWLAVNGSRETVGHPHVVVQENIFNHSRLQTLVMCALTTNLKRASSPGNVLLDVGEGNLPKQSVVEVSKLASVEKGNLGKYIGKLDERRINQILDGIRFLQSSFFAK